jgi:hypothetical protein
MFGVVCNFLNKLKFLFSYVFDGKPPDLKKQELAKRYFCYEFYHSLASLFNVVDI